MKVVSTILILVLVSEFVAHNNATLPTVGGCAYRTYIYKTRLCTTQFFVNMRRDHNAPCSPKFLAFKHCMVKKLLQCLTSRSESLIRNYVNSKIKEERYCNNAGISDPALHPKKGKVPCSQTYFQNAYSCFNETLYLWRTNKSDSRLCSVFSKAIKCEKSLIDTHCWYTGVTKEALDVAYDGYNPFCAPLTIPKAIPETIPETVPKTIPESVYFTKTSTKSNIASQCLFHHGLMLILALLTPITVAQLIIV